MSVPVPPLTAISLAEPDSDLMTTICRVCDGQATRADMDRLEQLLADPAAVTLYLAVRELDATLIWKNRWRRPWQPPQLAAATAGSQSKRPTCVDRLESAFDRVATVVGTSLLSLGHRLGSRAGIAVLLTLTVGLGLAAAWQAGLVAEPALRLIKTVFERQPPRLPGSVACVTALHAATWASNDDAAQPAEPPTRFASLFPGQWFDLEAGLVEISFDGGAVALVEGPTRFRIAAAGACRLEQGRLTATLDKAAARAAGAQARFAVETPTATVTDLGTSFGVAVGAAGETDVSVFDGLVELLPHSEKDDAFKPAKRLRLLAGESAVVATDRQVRRQTPHVDFIRTVPGRTVVDQQPPLPFSWKPGAAAIIVAESFAGSGPLHGSTPASRGGTGTEQWRAPRDGWQCDPEQDAVTVTQAGSAFLPFRPQRGFLYRLSITTTAPHDQPAAVGLGFTPTADPNQLDIDFSWSHDPSTSASDASAGGAGGSVTRTVILDTSLAEWRLFSLLNNRLVSQSVLHRQASQIQYLAIAVSGGSPVHLQSLSLDIQRLSRPK
jgi:hypothetical protein